MGLVRVGSSLAELVPGFLDGRRRDVDAIAAALERSDYDNVRILGHNMKGSGAGYGFNRITEIGASLEQAAETPCARGDSRAVRRSSSGTSTVFTSCTNSQELDRTMRVRFWGTRGSIATPGPGTIRFGGNTSCVEVTTSAGACFILDCGTGARALGAALMAHSPQAPLGDDPAEPHALGSHPGLSLLRPAVRSRQPDHGLRSGRKRTFAARSPLRPDGVHVLPRRHRAASGDDHVPGARRGNARDRRRAHRRAVPPSPGDDAGLPHRGRRCERRVPRATTSPSPKRSGTKAPRPTTPSPSRTRATGATRASWPARAW